MSEEGIIRSDHTLWSESMEDRLDRWSVYSLFFLFESAVPLQPSVPLLANRAFDLLGLLTVNDPLTVIVVIIIHYW